MTTTYRVLFAGREFISASTNVAKLLESKARNVTRPPRFEVRVAEMGEMSGALLREFDVAVPLMTRIPREAIEEASYARGRGKLKLIHQWGVGLEGIDFDAARENGVTIANCPSTIETSNATAEIAIYHLLSSFRGLGTDMFPVSSANGEHRTPKLGWGNPRGVSLSKKRIAVFGANGKVGRRICEMLETGFACDVVKIARSSSSSSAHRNTLLDFLRRFDREGTKRLDALVMAADLNSTSRHAFNMDVLDEIKRINGDEEGLFLVNVARGALVDPVALRYGLTHPSSKTPMISTYSTDVWFKEPPDFSEATEESRLLRRFFGSRIFLTPHVGGVVEETKNDEMCANGIFNFLVHGSLDGSVDGLRPATSIDLLVSNHLSKDATIDLKTQFSRNPAELATKGKDESFLAPFPPQAVFYPRTNEQIAVALKGCAALGIPVIPVGACTSLEGHVHALRGGVAIDLTKFMNRILEISAEDSYCVVQAGMTRKGVNEELRGTGLTFSVDPGADATIGGMTSTRASGTTAVAYGTMKERVSSLTVVTPDGKILRTNNRPGVIKSSAGYDLTSLFIGSEGTLGVITEVALKLVPEPEFKASFFCNFETLTNAVELVMWMKSQSVPIRRAELLDAITIRALKTHSAPEDASEFSNMAEKPSVFVELYSNSKSHLEENLQKMRESVLSQEFKGADFRTASDPTSTAKLWRARHSAYYAVMKSRGPQCRGSPTDVCVPVSQLSAVVEATEKDIRDLDLNFPIFGHIADGNFHVILLLNPEEEKDEEHMRKLKFVNERLMKRTLEVRGTITGEHGIGRGKMKWLERELGEEAIQMMKAIKQGIDPKNIMNPGKMFY